MIWSKSFKIFSFTTILKRKKLIFETIFKNVSNFWQIFSRKFGPVEQHKLKFQKFFLKKAIKP